MEIISSTGPTKQFDDWDFTFENGLLMPISIEEAAGDTIDFSDPACIVVQLSERPSMSDPDKKLPAEEIRIFTGKVLAIQHRKREVDAPTPEQKNEWLETLASLAVTGKTVRN